MERILTPIQTLLKYPLIITHHGRERWVERIVDSDHYRHLRICRKGCETCISLINDLRGMIRLGGRSIDKEIIKRYLIARNENNIVTEKTFIDAIKKHYERDADHLNFYRSGKAVLVVRTRPDEYSPVLLTVMSNEMLDGMVINTTNNHDLKTIFRRWHHEQNRKAKTVMRVL